MRKVDEQELRWRLADAGTLAKNSLKAIIRGRFLFKLKAERYFVHIIYTFFLFAMVIWISLMIETTMARVEKNRETLKEMEIIHSQKTFEMVSLSRRSTVEKMLKEMGSDVAEATAPATILVK